MIAKGIGFLKLTLVMFADVCALEVGELYRVGQSRFLVVTM